VESALKQRLVGAGVIIALGIIVIPMILDGAGERQLRKMPEAPQASKISKTGFIIHNQQAIKLPDEKPVVVTALKDQPVLSNDKTNQIKQEQADAIKTDKPQQVKKPVEKPKPVTKPVVAKKVNPVKTASPVMPRKKTVVSTSKQVISNKLQSWVVQVGSFTDAKKALSLRNNLRKKSYKAFVEKVSGRSGKLYRVRIGPVANRKLAEGLSSKLKTEGVKGFITRHP